MKDITDELPNLIGVPMRWISVLMKVIVTISGSLMAITFGLVVVIRYGFAGDLFAYEEWLLATSILGFFAGSVLASQYQFHINADILGVIFKDQKMIWWRGFIVLLIEVLVTLFVVYACYVSLLDDFSFPRLRATPVLKKEQRPGHGKQRPGQREGPTQVDVFPGQIRRTAPLGSHHFLEGNRIDHGNQHEQG